MTKLKYLMVTLGLVAMLSACTEDPTVMDYLTGEWEVENVIANGQVNQDDVFLEESILHLDGNGTFLFINVDGRASGGTFTASDTKLTLTSSTDGTVMDFNLVYVDYDKLHIYYSFTSQIVGQIEIRYLFRKIKPWM
jgi:hypothetical protein